MPRKRGDHTNSSAKAVLPWKQYQEGVAQLFRELGCDVATDLVVEGVRGKDAIDVSIRFVRFGLRQHWIVECKLWGRPVPKEKVRALKSIVDNIGADRGLLIAEAGHQSGAFAAARSTNITLISLADLRESAKAELLSLGLSEVRRRATVMKNYLFSLYNRESYGPYGGTWKLKPGVDGSDVIRLGGAASMIDMSEQAQLGKFPVVVMFPPDGEEVVRAKDLEEFLVAATTVLDSLDSGVREVAAGFEAGEGGR